MDEFEARRCKHHGKIRQDFCNRAWNIKFSSADLSHLPRTHSNHFLLLINTVGIVHVGRRKRPFRFLEAWMCMRNSKTCWHRLGRGMMRILWIKLTDSEVESNGGTNTSLLTSFSRKGDV